MITVNIKSKEFIEIIKINGHALYDDYGKDIVCASVSSIIITTINAIIRIDSNSINYEVNNGILIKVLNKNDITNKLLINMIDLLNELEKQYPRNIKIRRC